MKFFRKKKKVISGKAQKPINFINKLLTITDEKELEQALSKLSYSQLQAYKRRIEKDEELGFYLRRRFNKMKLHDYRRDFILDLVNKYELFDTFGGGKRC